MAESSDLITVYRIDNRCHEIFNGPMPSNTTSFQKWIVQAVKAEAKESGTHSIDFWRDVSAKRSSSPRCCAVFLTDGFEEGATHDEIEELKRVAASISTGNIQSITLLGANAKTKPLWDSVFLTKPQSKLYHFVGPLNRASIDDIERLVDAQ